MLRFSYSKFRKFIHEKTVFGARSSPRNLHDNRPKMFFDSPITLDNTENFYAFVCN
jgi:hypothetical protein